MTASPLFRVGDEVELWRMLLNFTILALVVMAFEKALHVFEKRAERYPKYHQMITKVYRELMILGILGLGIKMLKAAGVIVETSTEMVAFVSADLTIFFLAVALILQASTIFVQLRAKNKHMDNLELIGSDDLRAIVASHHTERRIQSAPRRWWTATKYDEQIRMRILRNLFLRMHKLPEIFPFAKYLRQAQDNQITHMIDLELSMWFVVFIVAWSFNASVSFLSKSELLEREMSGGNDGSEIDEEKKELVDDAQNHFALAAAFVLHAWSLFLSHLITMHCLGKFVHKLLQNAGVLSKAHMMERLGQVAVEESTNLASEAAADAIKRMEDVREEEQVRQYKRRHRLTKHDTGFQLIATGYRKLRTSMRAQKHRCAAPENRSPANPEREASASSPELHIPGFSRKAWHFAVKLFWILNGLYVALFIQTMVYHLPAFVSTIGILPTLLIPLPLLINLLTQTHILRQFILVSSLSRLHVDTLSGVITDFTEAVQLQSNFIDSIQHCLREHGRTVVELEELFETKDPLQTGWIDVEDMRQILNAAIGLQMSFFKFNSVMQLLFQLRHLKVDYRKVLTLLALAHDCDAHIGGSASGRTPLPFHYDRDYVVMRATTAASEKTSFVMMEEGRAPTDLPTPPNSSSLSSSAAIAQGGLHRLSKATRQHTDSRRWGMSPLPLHHASAVGAPSAASVGVGADPTSVSGSHAAPLNRSGHHPPPQHHRQSPHRFRSAVLPYAATTFTPAATTYEVRTLEGSVPNSYPSTYLRM